MRTFAQEPPPGPAAMTDLARNRDAAPVGQAGVWSDVVVCAGRVVVGLGPPLGSLPGADAVTGQGLTRDDVPAGAVPLRGRAASAAARASRGRSCGTRLVRLPSAPRRAADEAVCAGSVVIRPGARS